MIKYKDDKKVQGLLFKYVHFYANYNYVANSRKWYRKEIRIIRPNLGIQSYKDAQGFRLNNNKLKVKEVDAYIYHYGWVKSPQHTLTKNIYFQTLWHNDKDVSSWKEKNTINVDEYDYSKIDSLELFEDRHPSVMKERIENKNWEVNLEIKNTQKGFLNRILFLIEKYTGYRLFEYKNYIKI